MVRSVFRNLDPFIVGLLCVVGAASVWPLRGMAVHVFDTLSALGIVLLFFLHGAKLSREAIITGARNLKLHLSVLCVTYLVFPLLGFLLAALAPLSKPLAAGLVFLSVLPSTVQSSIAFTAIARGNVAAAVCSAGLSNLLGIFITPALVILLMRSTAGGLSLSSINSIVLQLLAPFVLGHLMRPLVGGLVARNRRLLSSVDRGTILLVVYTAFGTAVAKGLWHIISIDQLALVGILCALLLALVLLLTWKLGHGLHLERADAIALVFCGSKKSLASGVPMAGVLFPAAQVGVLLLPLMLFHQLQLIACAVIAGRYARAEPQGLADSYG